MSAESEFLILYILYPMLRDYRDLIATPSYGNFLSLN